MSANEWYAPDVGNLPIWFDQRSVSYFIEAVNTICSTALCVAPNAIRMPISRVCCATA